MQEINALRLAQAKSEKVNKSILQEVQILEQ
jgi:hypothetical protein